MINIRKTTLVLIIVITFIFSVVGTWSVINLMGRSAGSAGNISNDKLTEIQSYIDQYYLDDYKQADLDEGAYKGYVAGLGDVYSLYMPKDEYESFMATVTGDYDGVGIVFSGDNDGNYIVMDVVPGSPAEKAGVKPGDYILTVDGKTYDDADVMASHIRGKKGSTVKLELYIDGKTVKKELTREHIVQQSVSSKMLDDDTGYIEINSFIDSTYEDFEAALKKIENKKAKKLVLDLRNNGGGIVSECVNIADQFLDEGVVVYTEDKNGNLDSYNAANGKTKLKTVVLVNENSASASEILAAAMKDNGYTIVGTQTFGKGVIQSTVNLEDGSALKLTIMRYLSPKKHVIDKKGIKPNIKVEDDENTEADEQLEKALEKL